MQYIQASVVVIFTLVYPCLSSMEINLEPTPLAFYPFAQMRDICTDIECAKLDSSTDFAKSIVAQANTIYNSVSRVSQIVSAYCSSHSYTAVPFMSSTGLVCPTLSTLVSSGTPTLVTETTTETVTVTASSGRLSEIVETAASYFQQEIDLEPTDLAFYPQPRDRCSKITCSLLDSSISLAKSVTSRASEILASVIAVSSAASSSCSSFSYYTLLSVSPTGVVCPTLSSLEAQTPRSTPTYTYTETITTTITPSKRSEMVETVAALFSDN